MSELVRVPRPAYEAVVQRLVDDVTRAESALQSCEMNDSIGGHKQIVEARNHLNRLRVLLADLTSNAD